MSERSEPISALRRNPGFHGELPVEYRRPDSSRIRIGHTVKICEGGMMFLASKPLEVAELLEVKLYFNSPQGLVSISAVVRVGWADKKENENGYFLLGVNYICISPDNMAKLKLLLALHGN